MLLLQPERGDILGVIVFAVAVAVLSLATPITVETLVNTVAFGVLLWPVLILAGVLAACLVLAAAIKATQFYVVERMQRRLFARVVADYSHRFPRLKLEAFDEQYGPELANRFFDVLTLQKSLAFLLLEGVALVVTAAVGMAVLAFYHPFLLGFDVVLIALIAFLLFVLGIGGVRSSLHESHTKYDVAGWLEELLRSQRMFKFARGPGQAVERADHLTAEYVFARRAHFRVIWRQTLFALGLQVLASTALLGIGGYLVISRQLTLGQLVASELIVALVVASVAKLGKYAETFYDLMSSAEKLGVLTDLPMERRDGEVLKNPGVGMAIQTRGFCPIPVHHAKHHTWEIRPNERVAIVGPSGSGKSRFFEILCALRDAPQGAVELDGVDLRELSPARLREQVALVDRADVLTGSITDNVLVARSDVSAEEIRSVLELVGLLEAVRALPQGLDTQLTPSTGWLSSGQLIRLTIARALVGRPRLLILDGILDHLDLRSCPELLDRLFDRQAPWTLLISTHNPELQARCDRILSLGATGETASDRHSTRSHV